MTPNIETTEQYHQGIADLSRLMEGDPAPSSPEGLQLQALADALIAWERRTYPRLFEGEK